MSLLGFQKKKQWKCLKITFLKNLSYRFIFFQCRKYVLCEGFWAFILPKKCFLTERIKKLIYLNTFKCFITASGCFTIAILFISYLYYTRQIIIDYINLFGNCITQLFIYSYGPVLKINSIHLNLYVF